MRRQVSPSRQRSSTTSSPRGSANRPIWEDQKAAEGQAAAALQAELLALGIDPEEFDPAQL
ncbi:MAG: hypothetical protein ACRD0A_06945 [Acidimicrobiales bacterium]